MNSSTLAGTRCALFALAFVALPVAAHGQGTSVLTLIPVQGRLALGSEQSGALSTADLLSPDDHYLEAWELAARPGQALTIDVTSDAFDTRVHVVGPGLSETLTADDGGNGCNARLTFTALENGTFRVVASSAGPRATGTYVVRVSDRPAPPPTHACGEPDPALLLALSPQSPTLSLGSAVSGRLGSASPRVQDGRPGDAWDLVSSGNERVAIHMESDAFDSYLYVTGPGLDGVLSDDDGGEGLDSRIEVTLSRGTYRVVAAALSSGATGAYTLRVERPLDVTTLPTDGRSVELGQTVSGQLRETDPVLLEGRRGQLWEFSGAVGERVVIDLIAEDFDAYMYFAGPGIAEPLADDDGGDGLNSRITTTLPATGSYRIVVSSLSDGAGAFTLGVRRQ